MYRYYIDKFRDTYRQAAMNAMLGMTDESEPESQTESQENDEPLNLDSILSGRAAGALFRYVSTRVTDQLARFTSAPTNSPTTTATSTVEDEVEQQEKPKNNSSDINERLNQFVDVIKCKGRLGLVEEYESIAYAENKGTFVVCNNPINMFKNRYINIKCYDHSRVVLEPYDLPEDMDLDDPMDYINANFVDGYEQPRAYISTQGPKVETIMDFWRMMWQTCSRVIVMVTLNVENDMIKCEMYWPTADNRVIQAGVYKIEYIANEKHDDFVMTQIRLTNERCGVSRDIWHIQFISWPDFGTPQTATALLDLRRFVLERQEEAIQQTGPTAYPPIVVHCSAGVGRSGTFITVDICLREFEANGTVDVSEVVRKLRRQRYASIQTIDQYIFCYKSILEHASKYDFFKGIDLQSIIS